MNLSGLAGLGKVAGIGGIALGVLLLLLRPIIDASGSLPDPLRGWLLLTIAVGALAIGLVGMVLWALGSRRGAQVARAEGDYSGARNIDRTKGGSSQYARAKGDHSPAINERGR